MPDSESQATSNATLILRAVLSEFGFATLYPAINNGGEHSIRLPVAIMVTAVRVDVHQKADSRSNRLALRSVELSFGLDLASVFSSGDCVTFNHTGTQELV